MPTAVEKSLSIAGRTLLTRPGGQAGRSKEKGIATTNTKRRKTNEEKDGDRRREIAPPSSCLLLSSSFAFFFVPLCGYFLFP
jgi:hypothetical protein